MAHHQSQFTVSGQLHFMMPSREIQAVKQQHASARTSIERAERMRFSSRRAHFMCCSIRIPKSVSTQGPAATASGVALRGARCADAPPRAWPASLPPRGERNPPPAVPWFASSRWSRSRQKRVSLTMRRGADRSRVVSACDSSDVLRLLSPWSRHHTDSQVGALLLESFL